MAKRLRNALAMFAGVILAAGVLSGCAGDTGELDQQIAELETQVQRLQATQEAALQTASEEQAPELPVGATLVVEPSIFKFPEGRLSGGKDIWFYVSGLEPDQWITITMEADGLKNEVDIPGAVLRRANEDGTFIAPAREVRPGRFGVSTEAEAQGGVWLLSVEDTLTGAVLATTPWLVCGQNRENAWCEAAVETAIVPEPIVAGSGTIYNLDRFQIEDNLFQLRMGPESYWGYDAEARIDATAGDGIVMTIKLGDTLKFSRLGTSSSRTLTDHHLTIAGLGIDLEVPVGFRLEPWELKPDKAGEFVIDDSTDPGAHGKWLLIVTE